MRSAANCSFLESPRVRPTMIMRAIRKTKTPATILRMRATGRLSIKEDLEGEVGCSAAIC